MCTVLHTYINSYGLLPWRPQDKLCLTEGKMIYILQPVSGLGEGYAKLFKVAGRDAIVISLAHKTMQEIEMLETGRDDIFIITDAHLPVINQLTHKQGRIFGIVRQAVRFTFNPCLYHGLFVETHWAKKRLIQDRKSVV